MELSWPIAFLLILGGFLILMAAGMPIAFCFMMVNIIGVYLFWGGTAGLGQLILSIYSITRIYPLLAVPLFILMGEVMFRSGLAPFMIDAVDKWMGRLPGRLGLLAVASGTVFSTFTGTSIATTAVLGEVLTPEMEKHGYKKSMSLGPILGSGGLAMMIPPSGLAVFLGVVGEISVGKILMAIIMPGLLMAALYAAYIIIRCYLQPSVAPPYEVPRTSFAEKIIPTAKYILPLGFIIFLVIGVILLGLATPTEAAATGALGTFILAAIYGRLNWTVMKKSVRGAGEVTVMLLMIIISAVAYSQVLAFSGASRGLLQFIVSLPLSPILIFIFMQVVVLFLGMFMSAGAIILVTLPIYIPVLNTLGFSEVWFAVIMLLNIEMATTSPPYGLSLFVMRSVAPRGTTIGDCYRAALPFLGLDLIAMAIIIAFPSVALWLPGLMR